MSDVFTLNYWTSTEGPGQSVRIRVEGAEEIFLKHEEFDVLSTLRGVQSREEIVKNLRSQGVYRGSPETLAQLLIDHRLLIDLKDLNKKLESLTFRGPSSKIQTVGIMSCNRPLSLAPLLDDILSDARWREMRGRVLVFDDSRRDDALEKVRELVGEKAQLSPGLVCLMTRASRLKLVEWYSKRGIETSVASFAFLGDNNFSHSIGANRNSALVLTRGLDVLSLDDDVCAKFAPVPQSTSDILTVCGHNRISETRWWDPNLAIPEDCQSDSISDFLNRHDRVLGKSLRDLREDFSLDSDRVCSIEEVDGAIHRAVHNGPVTVRMSFAYQFGHDGTGPGVHYLFQSGRSFQQLVKDRSLFDLVLLRKSTFPGPSNYVVSAHGKSMMGAFGFKNEELLPPFIPNFIGEDDLFGFVMRRLEPNFLAGHVPVGIYHGQDRPPKTVSAVVDGLMALNICPVLISLIQDRHERPDSELSFARLAQVFRDFASQSDEGVYQYLTQLNRGHLQRLIESCEQFLDINSKAPDFYLSLLKQIRTTAQDKLKQTPTLPIEFQTLDLGVMKFKSFISQYSSLLDAWPEILKLASTNQEELGILGLESI